MPSEHLQREGQQAGWTSTFADRFGRRRDLITRHVHRPYAKDAPDSRIYQSLRLAALCTHTRTQNSNAQKALRPRARARLPTKAAHGAQLPPKVCRRVLAGTCGRVAPGGRPCKRVRLRAKRESTEQGHVAVQRAEHVRARISNAWQHATPQMRRRASGAQHALGVRVRASEAACGRRAASARPQGRGDCVVLRLTCAAATAGGPEAELRASACSATRAAPGGVVPRVGHSPAGACIRCTHTVAPRQIVGAARRHTSRRIRRAASISDISSREPPRAEVPTLRTPTPTPHERRTRLRASSRRRRPTSSFTRIALRQAANSNSTSSTTRRSKDGGSSGFASFVGCSDSGASLWLGLRLGLR